MPRAGFNGVLVTRSRSGDSVSTGLRIDGLSHDLNLVIRKGFRKSGPSYQPIRLAERFLKFTALYNAADRGGFEHDMKTIMDHIAYCLNGNNTVPMKLIYRGNAAGIKGGAQTFLGHIDGFRRSGQWDEVLFRRDFRMRMITAPSGGAYFSQRFLGAPYIPHRGDIEQWGSAWYSTSELKNNSRLLNATKSGGGKGSNNQSGGSNKPHPPNHPGHPLP